LALTSLKGSLFNPGIGLVGESFLKKVLFHNWSFSRKGEGWALENFWIKGSSYLLNLLPLFLYLDPISFKKALLIKDENFLKPF